MRTRREDFEGYGVYQRTAGDAGMLDALTYGVYAPLGEVPADVATVFSPVFATEQRDGLVYVQPLAKEPAIAALNLLVFDGNPAQPATNITGYAEMPTGLHTGSWVQDYVAAGYVVMVDVGQGLHAPPFMVACSKDPQVVAATAGIGKNVAIMDGPASVLIAASSIALASAPATTTTSKCPAGQTWVPVLNQCVAGLPTVPGLPWQDQTTPAAQQAAVAPAASTTPKWVVPVLLAAGALVVVGVVYETTKKPVVARRNRR